MDKEKKIYDIIIIGAGPGGYHSAIRAAQYGANVALIEKEYVGGTCTNWGCIPTKAFYSSALLMEELQEKSSELGISIEGKVHLDFNKVVEHKNKIVKESREGIRELLRIRKDNIVVMNCFGKLEGGNSVSGFDVSCADSAGNKNNIKGKRVIIATGTTPAQTHAFNIDHNNILTCNDIFDFEFTELPKSLIIIGSDFTACELANVFARFGCDVTMIWDTYTILESKDNFIIKAVETKFKENGIKILMQQTLS
ncbi:MAG: FAD-dependent oxidoreductase, partial [Promethearchaeota archaeon]